MSWTKRTGRTQDLATVFGGRLLIVSPSMLAARSLTGFRYLWSFAVTVVLVVLWRPRVVIAMNPPIFCQLAAFLGTSIVGAGLILDSHPGAFGYQHDPVGLRTRRVHRWLCGRANSVLVTTESLGDEVSRAGGQGLLVHEPPPRFDGGLSYEDRQYDVVVASVFARDEPVEAIVEVAKRLPRLRIGVTGEYQRAPKSLLGDRPANIELVGFVSQPSFLEMMASARVVVVLTDDAQSVPRTAYEASYLGVPLVVSDWPPTREYFPHAFHALNSPGSIAASITDVLKQRPKVLEARVALAREACNLRWLVQREALAHAVAGALADASPSRLRGDS